MYNNFLIPEGFNEDVTFNSYIEHKYKNSIINYFRLNGFDLVKTPLIEYSSGSSENNFLIFTNKNEEKLKIRNDITPQIIRLSSSRLLKKKRPLKLCYYGEVVRKKGSMLRPERQFLQVGAEVIGSNNTKADIEIINLAYLSLKNIGIKNITIELSSKIFLEKFFNKILNKSIYKDLEKAIKNKDINKCLNIIDNDKDKEKFQKFFDCTGNYIKIKNKLELLSDDLVIQKEINNLCKIAENIKITKNDNIYIDFCEIDEKKYHNGLKFTFFAKDVRGEIASGGRYSIINEKVKENATGFTCFMDTVLRASSFENLAKKILIPTNTSEKIRKKLIDDGYVLFAIYDEISDIKNEAARHDCDYYLKNLEIKKI